MSSADPSIELETPEVLLKIPVFIAPAGQSPAILSKKKQNGTIFIAPVDKNQPYRLVKYLKGIILNDIQSLGTNTAKRQLAASE